MKLVPVIVRSTGVNNRVDPVSITYSTKDGIADLATAQNFVISDALRLERRQGRNKVADGEYHSLYSHAGNKAFVVRELSTTAELLEVNKDYSLTGLRSGLSKDKHMSFVRAGDWYYYSNGEENGVIKEDGKSYSWPVYSSSEKTTRQFSPAPVGEHLAWFSGHLFVVQGDTIFRSEQFETGLYDLRLYNRFKSRVLMVKPVMGGIFVSTETETLFLAGTDPNEFEQLQVFPYPAIEWSDATDYTPASKLGLQITGNVALWMSTEGVIAGLSTGEAVNLTEDKMLYPEASEAASLLYKNKLIYSMR